ncbi:MAG: trypsin-like peptidase domain-containing protein [Chloroflexi bacterium]|nr:trypsin-like peptidase domain-containing protein [Chloroflexota bacterium]
MFFSSLKRLALILSALLLIAFGFMLGTALVQIDARNTPLQVQVAQTAAQTPITDTERLFANIYNRVSPSVVSINVRGGSVNQLDSFEASGTGFVLDKNGYIVTNNHVVDGATDIEVNFLDGTIVEGDIVGVDPDADIAVLRVNLPPENLSPVTFGDSDQLFIGQTTLAIGSPFGQRWTLTSGIISALGRTINGLTQFSVGSVIQTDAAINPGNSGGPLLNLRGEVIGVNSQIISRTRSNSGIGFAVPSNLVKRVVEELVNNGRVNYSYLGIQSVGAEGVTLQLIRELNLPNNLRGVIVDSVVAGGPAAAAGLRNATNGSADVITAIDGQPIQDMNALVSYLASKTKPGQTVNLTVWRGGQTINLPVTLGERP